MLRETVLNSLSATVEVATTVHYLALLPSMVHLPRLIHGCLPTCDKRERGVFWPQGTLDVCRERERETALRSMFRRRRTTPPSLWCDSVSSPSSPGGPRRLKVCTFLPAPFEWRSFTVPSALRMRGRQAGVPTSPSLPHPPIPTQPSLCVAALRTHISSKIRGTTTPCHFGHEVIIEPVLNNI